MSTYPGLAAATRESVSLDEDEPSDIEDEVFIRDGRSGYKLAEDRGVKRPLMAPRRKLGKPDLASRLKNRPPCRMLCIPCCYAFIALTIFLGLIVVVIVLVAIFPLPLDTVKSWIVSKSNSAKAQAKSIPCTDLQITDVWTVNLPKLASESPMRNIDVNNDGIDDIVFGFGLGEDVQLPQQWFCPMFLGVKPPCQGGVIALDGTTGQQIWRRWLPHTVFSLHCIVDLNGDNVSDCLASGKGGVLSAINGYNGTIIWEFINNKTSLVMDVYFGSTIPDQDADGISDFIAAHTLQSGNRTGYIIIISGKTGLELSRVLTPNSTEILFAPQYFLRNNKEDTILFGTGSQSKPGGLYIASLKDILLKQMNPTLLYNDPFKGIVSPVIFADITGDQIDDIISAMFNSTIVAIDGQTFKQIWNYTLNNSESLSTPTPGYFNSDNVTDFLVKYETGPGFPVYYFSQTIIIDGKTGKKIYKQPIIDSVGTQMGGLTISMENYGNDMFIFWMADCKDNEGRKDTYSFDNFEANDIWKKSKANLCKLRFNSTTVTKLYGINEFVEPPGILLYTSDNRTALEYNNSRTPLEEVRQYLQENPDFDITFRNTRLEVEQPSPISQLKNFNFKNINNLNFNKGLSNFRHRNDGQGLVKDFIRQNTRNRLQQSTNLNVNVNNNPPTDQQQFSNEDKFDYDQWVQNPAVDDLLDPSQLDYPDAYSDDADQSRMMNPNLKPILNPSNNRDPRSKTTNTNTNQQQQQQSANNKENIDFDKRKSKKKNLAENQNYGPNDYKNIYMARNRLLHDLNDLPTEILRETYVKNRKRQFRNNKFQQRDVRYHLNKTDDIEDQVKDGNFPESLWDLESEKELEDRENGYWRGKRDASDLPIGIPRISSTGVLVKPLGEFKTGNAIDLVFATYWILPKYGAFAILEKDADCIKRKMKESEEPNNKYYNLEKLTKEDLFTKICLEERGVSLQAPNYVTDPKNEPLKISPYFNQFSELSLGQMTVYRLRLECKCQILKAGERCAKILDAQDQLWSSYMGKNGTGKYKTH